MKITCSHCYHEEELEDTSLPVTHCPSCDEPLNPPIGETVELESAPEPDMEERDWDNVPDEPNFLDRFLAGG